LGIRNSLVIAELDNVNTWHVTPKVLLISEWHQWRPCLVDESRLAEFLHPLRLPTLLFERGVAVLLVSVPVFGLTSFAAVLWACQSIDVEIGSSVDLL